MLKQGWVVRNTKPVICERAKARFSYEFIMHREDLHSDKDREVLCMYMEQFWDKAWDHQKTQVSLCIDLPALSVRELCETCLTFIILSGLIHLWTEDKHKICRPGD